MDSESELNQNWAELVRETTRDLELTETNLNRFEAARRQVDAVIEAYRSDSTTADQVLEAIRRRAEAHASYARTVSDLSRVPARRDYLLTLGSWIAMEHAASDTKTLWAEAADRGRPRKELDQFNEQYNQLRESAQKALMKLKYVQGLPANLQKHIAANSDEWNLGIQATKPIGERKLELGLGALERERADLEKVRTHLEGSTASIEAQLLALSVMQQRQQQFLESSQRSMAELAAKKAALEAEIAKKAAALDARHKESLEKVREELHRDSKRKVESTESEKKPEAPTDDRAHRRMTPAEKLGLVNSLMADARETWKQTYQQFHSESRSVEALAEAVARERYFQVKRITQQLLRDALVLATSAW
jgi:hypothetical protein